MFPWSLFLNPTVLLGIALAGALAFGGLQTHRLGSAQERIGAITAQFEDFKASVQAQGRAAQERAESQAKADKQRQEKANVQNQTVRARDAAVIAQLRRERDSARSSIVPTAASAPTDPGRASFDRAELESALRVLLGEVRGLVDEGSAAVVDLNSAKLWAGKLSYDMDSLRR